MSIDMLNVINSKTIPAQPLFEDLEKDPLYVIPGRPVLTENPFEFTLPLLFL